MSDDIGDWLKRHDLAVYTEHFLTHRITLDLLPELQEEDLDELNVSPEHRKLLLKAIGNLAGNTAIDSVQNQSSSTQIKVGPGSDIGGTVTRAERRHMTVMFIDIANSSRLSNTLDPERYARTLKQFQHLVIDVVEQWEGFVARFFGNGVLAYFGWPIAAGNDAERAVRCALEISTDVSQLKTSDDEFLSCRIGLATGLVLVEDIVGDRETYQDAIYGVTPNLAARLQSCAMPDEILIAPATAQLVNQWFKLESQGSAVLKGIDEEVELWKVAGSVTRATRFEANSQQIELTTYAGRVAELGQLRSLWSATLRGEGSIVLISGDAGIGKSRLVHQFCSQLGLGGEAAVYLQCSPFHQNTTAFPILQHFEQLLSSESADSLKGLSKLLLASGVTDPNSSALIGWFMGRVEIQDLPIANKDATRLSALCMDIFIRYMVGLSAQSPTVLIIEDAQWIDPTTSRFIDQLAAAVSSESLMVLVTARESYKPQWSQIDEQHIIVKPLDPSNTAALICAVTGVSDLPDNLVQSLTSATSGNPLFLEEVTRMLVSNGQLVVEDQKLKLKVPFVSLSIPLQLRDSLTGRIDALAQAKSFACLAAAIGRSFSFDMICSISAETPDKVRDHLNKLLSTGVISAVDSGQTQQFQFTHSLLQEAAYEMVLQQDKRRMHARIADKLQAHTDDVNASPQILAYHYERANQKQQAVEYLLQASKRSLELSASDEALGLLQRGLRLIDELPSSQLVDRLRMRYHASIGTAYMLKRGWGAKEVDEAYSLALTYQHAARGPEEKQWLSWGAWVYKLVSGQLRSSEELADAMLLAVQNTTDTERLLIAHMVQMHTNFYTGNFTGALKHGENMVRYYDNNQHADLCHKFSVDVLVVWHVHAAQIHWFLGDATQAEAEYQQVIRLADSTTHLHTRLWAHTWGANYLLLSGQAQLILDKFPALIEESFKNGFVYTTALARIILTDARILQSQSSFGFERNEQALQAFQATGAGITVPYFISRQASALAKAGRYQEALNKTNLALEQSELWGEQWSRAFTLFTQGEILASGPTPELYKAQQALEAAIKLATYQQCVPWCRESNRSLQKLTNTNSLLK